MIEMRWIRRPGSKGNGFMETDAVPGQHGMIGVFERVLQFRQRVWNDGVGPFGGSYSQWSHWQDVPYQPDAADRSEK